jgi:hypothetical protein
MTAYGNRDVATRSARSITIDLDAFDEETQLRILRFIQQQKTKA